jgi:thioredoxin 1
MSAVIITKDNFEQEVIQSEIPVVVDFWAEWCGPCKVLSPIIEELAGEHAGKIKLAKVDVDANQELQLRYNIMSIPTMKFFKNGQIVGEIVGAAPKGAIDEEIKKHIN